MTATLNEKAVLPNFLYIGADRCGSKSLHRYFRQHPECYVPPIADPYFFDRHYDRGLDWYSSLFAGAPDSARAIGEFSHDYLHSPEAAHRIASDLPGVKLLATLRHPIDRTFSSYMGAFNARDIRTPLEQAIKEIPMLIGNSMYADNLEPYFELIDRDRIKVMFFEDLENDSQSFATEAFGFVNLPPADDIDYETRMSPLCTPNFPMAGALTKLASRTLRRLGWVNALGRLKSNPRIRSVFYTPYAADDKPKMNPDTRKALREIFAPQIDRLEKMLGRDLSAWRT